MRRVLVEVLTNRGPISHAVYTCVQELSFRLNSNLCGYWARFFLAWHILSAFHFLFFFYFRWWLSLVVCYVYVAFSVVRWFVISFCKKESNLADIHSLKNSMLFLWSSTCWIMAMLTRKNMSLLITLILNKLCRMGRTLHLTGFLLAFNLS